MSLSKVTKLIENKDWKTVQNMVSSTELDTESFSFLFESAQKYHQYDLLKELCIKEQCTTADLDAALFDACNKEQWELVADLCTLNQGKLPSIQAIARSLSVLFSYSKYDLLKSLCVKVNPEALNKFILALPYFLPESLEIRDHICKLESYKANSPLHNQLLTEALQNLQWDLIKYLVQSELTFAAETLTKALETAISKSQLSGVQALCQKKGNNKPSPEQVLKVIQKAIEYKSAPILAYMYNEFEILPTKMNSSLLTAANEGNWDSAKLFFTAEEEKIAQESVLRLYKLQDPNKKPIVPIESTANTHPTTTEKLPSAHPAQQQNKTIILEPLVSIIDTLIKNISKTNNPGKENTRWTSGKGSAKVKLLEELKDEMMLRKDPKKNYAEEIQKICLIRRHKLNFLARPHSVDEYADLLQLKGLTIASFAPQMVLGHK